MKIHFVLSACLMIQATAASQTITVTVNNLDTGKVYLSALSGEKVSRIDSVTSSGNGRFAFALNNRQNHVGIYRLSFDGNRWIDFVNDGEDVEITSDANALVDSLSVLKSESNRLYYAFRKLNQQYKRKSEVLQLVLARYPHDDPYYTTTVATVFELQKGYHDFVRSATSSRPSSFVAHYIQSAQLPIVDLTQPPDKQLAYLKGHALDYVDFADDELIRSDLFTSKTIEYLTYYRNPQLPKELLAKEFNTAVDTILTKAKVNLVVYKHITEYLLDGFKQFGFEECINYILDSYVIKDDLCLDQASGSTIQRMIDQKKHLPIGAEAPTVVLPDTSGNSVSLFTMTAEKILVLFYSSTCPHCQFMIPRLAEITKGRDTAKLKVFAVSLDGSQSEWLHFIRTNALTWTNVNDPAGWGGRTAADYFIYATPTMILLDGERRIIGKLVSIEELNELL